MTDPLALADKVLIGTTDTADTGNPDALSVTEGDRAYLLEGFNHYFRPNLETASILGSFVGLRPLIRSRPGEPSSQSREYRIIEGPSGLLSVAGGKYTTYRHMAEVVTDEVMRRLGRRRRCRTPPFALEGTPPGSWPAFFAAAVRDLRRNHGLEEKTARHLVGRYGQRAWDVMKYVQQVPVMAEPLVAGEPDLRAEWAYQRDHEMAMVPADHWLRRTRLGLYRPELVPGPGHPAQSSLPGP
jgi:glycerol-3-phosphate dehydrogenase